MSYTQPTIYSQLPYQPSYPPTTISFTPVPTSYASEEIRPMTERSGPPSIKDGKEQSHPVNLAPWAKVRLPVVGLIIAVVLQGILMISALALWKNPTERPVGARLMGGLSTKGYNVLVSICGAIVNGAATFGLAVGARSYLSQKLLGNGVNLHEYDSLWAVGNGGLGRRLTRYAAVPLVLYIFANLASTAINGIFVATNTQVTTNFKLGYSDPQANPAYYASIADIQTMLILNPGDFEGVAYSILDTIRRGYNASTSSIQVDGISTAAGTGVTPALFAISNMRSSISAGSHDFSIPRPRADIISHAGTNEYHLVVPTTVARSTCFSHWTNDANYVPPTFIISDPVNNTGSSPPTISVEVTDPICGERLSLSYLSYPEFYGGMFHCYVNKKMHSTYFAIRAYGGELDSTALASCNTTVVAGSIPLSYNDAGRNYSYPPNTDLYNLYDWTDSTEAMIQNWMGSYTDHNTASPGLSHLVYDNLGLLDPKMSLPYGQPWDTLFKAYTQAICSLPITKLINSNTEFGTDPLYFNSSASNFVLTADSTATSDAIVIGPTGHSAALVIIFTFMLLCFALWITIQAPPVTFNPLDPVSVLLVAQNSPPSIGADGGCLGEVSQVRDPNVSIQYRAVNNQHLAFVFGENYYEPPKFGRLSERAGRPPWTSILAAASPGALPNERNALDQEQTSLNLEREENIPDDNFKSFTEAAEDLRELGGLVEVQSLLSISKTLMGKVEKEWENGGRFRPLQSDTHYRRLMEDERVLGELAKWLDKDVKQSRWIGQGPSVLEFHKKRAKELKDDFWPMMTRLLNLELELREIDRLRSKAGKLSKLVFDLREIQSRLNQQKDKYLINGSSGGYSTTRPSSCDQPGIPELGISSRNRSPSGHFHHGLRRASSLADFRSESSSSSFDDSD
ncbi:hypothetical protein T439DRAFT_354010 [Meredithblackwellia eburnea MCA 4105]